MSNIPVMNVAFIITDSDSYIPHFAHVKMRVVLVIVWCDPAHPHATRLLARKHSHRIIVLEKEKGGWFQVKMTQNGQYEKLCNKIPAVQLTSTDEYIVHGFHIILTMVTI